MAKHHLLLLTCYLQIIIATVTFITGKSMGFPFKIRLREGVHQPLQEKGFTEVSDRGMACEAEAMTVSSRQ